MALPRVLTRCEEKMRQALMFVAMIGVLSWMQRHEDPNGRTITQVKRECQYWYLEQPKSAPMPQGLVVDIAHESGLVGMCVK